MSINNFYNTTAIYEIPTITIDTYGQDTKSWTVSTYIIGRRQGRSGDKSIYTNFQEKANYNDRFYCDVCNVGSSGRLLFSTNAFVYQGVVSTSSGLTSTEIGALYNVASTFSTYVQGDYLINSSTGYGKKTMTYRDILYINDNLKDSHFQIDLKVDYGNKS